jgi:DnaJ-class molecular chaperone
VKRQKITRSINGQSDAKILEIEVRPGWKNGTKITFDNEDDRNYGATAQDVIFVITEEPHDIEKRNGDDLITEEVVSLKQALCGFSCSRKSVDGEQVVLNVLDGGDNKSR